MKKAQCHCITTWECKWKKSGQRHAIVHKKIWLRKEIALEDRADGDENKNTRELLIEKKGFPSVYHSTYILCDLLTKY